MTAASSRPGVLGRTVAVVVGIPVAAVVLLGVQALLALRTEYLPDDPGYAIDVTAPEADDAGEALQVVVLGDSTVAGLGADAAEESLPGQLADRLAHQLGRPVRVVGYGVSGAVTRDVTAEQAPLLDGVDPDVVIAVVGSNDVTNARPPWALRRDLEALRDAVGAQTDAPLVLAGIPLFGGADALARPLRDVVDAYATVLRNAQRDAAADLGIGFVEIARDASPRFEGVADAMSDDGFHPAPTGYGFWADAIAATVAADPAVGPP